MKFQKHLIMLTGDFLAGKSTACRIIKETIGTDRVAVISIGELLKKQEASIPDWVLQGDLAPEDLMRNLVTKEIERLQDVEYLVIDGAPRIPSQVGWSGVLAMRFMRSLSFIDLHLEDPAVLRERSENRGRADATFDAVRVEKNRKNLKRMRKELSKVTDSRKSEIHTDYMTPEQFALEVENSIWELF